MVTDWLLIFAGGLLGSSHCVGMCGGFVLALGGTGRSPTANVLRQLAYGLGRVFTYATAGVAAGYGGGRLVAETRSLMNAQALLSIAAGLLLLVQGLSAAGVLRPGVRSSGGACLGPGLFGSLLRETRLRSVFLGGVVNGLLPCGLVYAYLALAASSGSLWRGAATMALFGLGTMPLLVLLGSCGGSLLSLAGRRLLLRGAAWCVVATGVITLWRGLGCLPWFTGTLSEGCPMCR
jgi:sulfite exporter TauE/SafE